jgi:hypothetical protein
MYLDKPVKRKLSLGALRKANKTKPKSPDLTGQMSYKGIRLLRSLSNLATMKRRLFVI